ncbi:FYVE, RhoGEF and PH domain-containing 2 [Gossypium arboreum]|uniref:FYVE, RhoGEF and PH domain-containing 2 n=1 Tax=Gossypium arboreum TaxID=29729 RepID=A0A0B0N0Y0_GOSAR|nr:uncharacterized protein LOC108465260 [Gossypium arboreum]KHG06267.1 FYVE, RhoGEF and PH domain-containing 2 [Gossypium arboreum]
MRGSIGRTFSNPTNHYLTSLTKRTSFLFQSSSPFSASSSSGDGRGRGRGREGVSPSGTFGGFTPALGKPDSEDTKRDSAESQAVGSGHGRGRGIPLSSEPIIPSFSSFVSQNGSGRGRVTNESVRPTPPPPPPPPLPPREAKQPIFVMKQDEIETDLSAKLPAESVQSSERTFSPRTPSVASLSGAGRGKPVKQPGPVLQTKEENRHIRLKQQQQQQQQQQPPSPRLSKEEAVKKAMGILSRKSESDEREDMGRSGGRGRGRGRGRGARMGRGRGRREREDTGEEEEADKELRDELYLGNNADGERLAETIGADSMNKLVEGFEEISSRVLPSPMDDAYLEALHTNFMIEFEPEYLMEEFGTNPDIDEKPPMSLRDALEKVKPFLMSYEGIENQEEWEEAIKETMDKVPLLQEIIDYYSGPDRVTAKKQQEELERVAKTIPKSVPASVKQFANRAVLTLQSNPGWGFDKKCQFMDKLVCEVSQQYK